MISKRTATITVGICAYNEEANIKNTIVHLLSQKNPNFKLLELLVVSDGSTDQTVQQAESVNDPRVKVFDNHNRLGKTTRLNFIFERAKGDIIVCSDADLITGSEFTISRLISPFIDDIRVGYTGGMLKPLAGKTFTEKAVNYSREVWDKIKIELRGGDSVYSCTGGLFAISGSLAKKTRYPDNIWADLAYPYFMCLNNNLKFKSVKSATIIFRAPSSLKEYIGQFKRYMKESENLYLYFDKNTVQREYLIPKLLLYKLKFSAFIKHPIHLIYIFIINLYVKYISNINKGENLAKWQLITSTKRAITNDYT